MNAQNLLVETAKMMDVVDIQTCYYIYKMCNGRQWEPIPCSDFIGIMNMKETQVSIRILHREKVRVCYLIYATSKHLAFPALEKQWIAAMLVRFGINAGYYKSHYWEATASYASDSNKSFVSDLKSALSRASW
jgi:hypothetical protein